MKWVSSYYTLVSFCWHSFGHLWSLQSWTCIGLGGLGYFFWHAFKYSIKKICWGLVGKNLEAFISLQIEIWYLLLVLLYLKGGYDSSSPLSWCLLVSAQCKLSPLVQFQRWGCVLLTCFSLVSFVFANCSLLSCFMTLCMIDEENYKFIIISVIKGVLVWFFLFPSLFLA